MLALKVLLGDLCSGGVSQKRAQSDRRIQSRSLPLFTNTGCLQLAFLRKRVFISFLKDLQRVRVPQEMSLPLRPSPYRLGEG